MGSIDLDGKGEQDMSTPAGWYDDGSGTQRWWDGQQWTDHSAPGAPVASPPAALATAPSLGGDSGGAPSKTSKPWYLRWWVWVLAAIILIAVIANLAGGGRADDDENALPGTSTTEPAPPTETDPPDAEPTESTDSEAAEEQEEASDAGSAQNPLPQPYVAKGFLGGEKYSLVARVFNASANEQVKAWNMFNDDAPAGFKYVVVEMTMTGIDPDGVEPSLAVFDLNLATAEGNRYDAEFVVFAEEMPSMLDGPTLYPPNAFTGYSAYIVPDTAQSFLLYDNANYVALQ